ncbi:MAG TPA: class I SAM-dependent methyltransferase [bacterium]|nr:class I SAM-dependent methyltransferase [bacterium]
MVDFTSRYYPESRFGGFADVDGTVVFYTRVNSFITADSVVLDVGCGVGVYGSDPAGTRRKLRIMKGKCLKVIGLDVDPQARENPFLDEFHLVEEGPWPVEAGSVDVIIADNMLEHVAEPDRFFAECNRVLKKGGRLFIRTPNVWSYFGLLSRLVPDKFHHGFLARIKHPREEFDVFPTYYRCNGIRKLRKLLRAHGFDACVYGYEAEPKYLSFSRAAFFLGVLHQRYAPRFLKLGIFAFAEKIEHQCP